MLIKEQKRLFSRSCPCVILKSEGLTGIHHFPFVVACSMPRSFILFFQVVVIVIYLFFGVLQADNAKLPGFFRFCTLLGLRMFAAEKVIQSSALVSSLLLLSSSVMPIYSQSI